MNHPSPAFTQLLNRYFCLWSSLKHWILPSPHLSPTTSFYTDFTSLCWEKTQCFLLSRILFIFLYLSLFFFLLWESSVFHIFISLTLYFYFKRIISNLQNCRENDLLVCSVNTLLSTYYASGPFLDSGNRAVHQTKSPMSWSRHSPVPDNVTWWSHRAHLSSFVYS